MLNIYVGNLSPTAVENDLRRAFQPHGRVTAVSIIRDRRTGRSRGFGYVEMRDERQARSAVRAVNRSEVRGKTLAVRPARLRETQADFGDFAR